MKLMDSTAALEHINGIINKSFANDEIRDISSLEKLLKFLLQTKPLEDDKCTTPGIQHIFSRQISWFLNKLLFISIHDENQSLTANIKLLLDKCFRRGHEVDFAWLRKFNAFLETVINKIARHDISKEPLVINFPGHEIEGNLQFSPIVAKKQVQLELLLNFMLESVSISFEISSLCLETFSLSESLHFMLGSGSDEMKNEVLKFLNKYYKLVWSSDVLSSINKTVRSLEIMFEYWSTLQARSACMEFYHTIHEFFSIADGLLALEYKFDIDLIMFVSKCANILYYDSRMIQSTNVPSIAKVLVSLLEERLLRSELFLPFNEALQCCIEVAKEKAEIVMLLKFLIVMEMEKNENVNVCESSKIWNMMHECLLQRANALGTHASEEKFMEESQWIIEVFKLALETEFLMRRNLQMLHAKGQGEYKRINFVFFRDLHSLSKVLIDALKTRLNISSDLMVSYMELFAAILKQDNTNLLTSSEETKLLMLSIVMLPFHDKITKLAKCANSNYSHAMKSYLTCTMTETENLLRIKTKSIALMSLLNLSLNFKESKSYASSYLQLILIKESAAIQSEFFKVFPDFLISNATCLSMLLDVYQTHRLSKNTAENFEELGQVLCLNKRDVTVLKRITGEYKIICNLCEGKFKAHYNGEKESPFHQLLRYNDYFKACTYIITELNFDQNSMPLKIKFGDPSTHSAEARKNLIAMLPSCITHDTIISHWLKNNEADKFLDILFQNNEPMHLHEHAIPQIMSNLKNSLTDDEMLYFTDELLNRIEDIVLGIFCDETDAEKQVTFAKIISLLGSNNKDADVNLCEETTLKCVKLLINFIINDKSCIQGLAYNTIVEMLWTHNVSILQFLSWYNRNIIESCIHACVYNALSDGERTPLSQSLKKVSDQIFKKDGKEFMRENIDIILSCILHFCITNDAMVFIEDILNYTHMSFNEAIEVSALTVYESFYKLEPEEKQLCINYVEKETRLSFGYYFALDKKNVLPYIMAHYFQDPLFFVEVVQIMEGENGNNLDEEKMADYISAEMLGVLQRFEVLISSKKCEKMLKKKILLSLCSIIPYLGGKRVGVCCFKIMGLLKMASTQTEIDLKKSCLDVWKILIHVCDIHKIGPLLGSIFAALEPYIEEHAAKVKEITRYLIIDNRNLLSVYIPNLFFIRKTNFDESIKKIINDQIESQHMEHENDFEINLARFINQMQNENLDSDLKVYCLQYLHEIIESNRKTLNDLIFASTQTYAIIPQLISVLSQCCKNFYHKKLQLHTAISIGEIGAIQPTLQKNNFQDDWNFMTSIHSEAFAKKALSILCQFYRDTHQSQDMDSISLAIQEILKDQEIKNNNYLQENNIWMSLQEIDRTLIFPLLSSAYVSTKDVNSVVPTEVIFWNEAQSVTDWCYKFIKVLTSCIEQENTKLLLLSILNSMQNNLEILTLFLPLVFLHYLNGSSKKLDKFIAQEFNMVFAVVLQSAGFDGDDDEFESKMLLLYNFVPIVERDESAENSGIVLVSHKVAKKIFEIWDYLTIFLLKHENTAIRSRIDDLQKQFCKRKLAEINLKCEEYERAMIFLESYLRELPSKEQDLPLLMKIYGRLGDPDLVEGVKAVSNSKWSKMDEILIHGITGNLKESLPAINYFSHNIKQYVHETDFSVDHANIIIDSYLQSNHYKLALQTAEEILKELGRKEKVIFDEIKAEPLWRLSKFDDLEQLFSDEMIFQENSWNKTCGMVSLKFVKGTDEEFDTEITNGRTWIMNKLKIVKSEEAIYSNNYKDIIRLHILTDVEKIRKAFNLISQKPDLPMAKKVIKDLISELNLRKKLINSCSEIESILSLHRVLLNEASKKSSAFYSHEDWKEIYKIVEVEIGRNYIDCAKVLCKKEMFSEAKELYIQAENYQIPELFIEQAKYSWKIGNQTEALTILNKTCDELQSLSKSQETKNLLAKGEMLIARYNAEAVNVDFETNKNQFKKALNRGTENEKGYMLYAKYLDRYYFTEDEKVSDHATVGSLVEVIEAYGTSMKYGSTYVLQSMSRLLQIWVDTTSGASVGKLSSRHILELTVKMNEYVRRLVTQLRPFCFYATFSQLVSHLCHSSKDVFQILKIIICSLIEKYPLQSLWYVMPGLKSNNPLRVSRTQELIKDLKRDTRAKTTSFEAVIDNIMRLSAKKEQNEEIYMSQFCPNLDKLLQSANILMPLQQNLQMVQDPYSGGALLETSQVFIHRIDDKVEIIRSLQQPKKIVFIGSDGHRYPMLLKSKDDLRIDFRFMEFLKLVNDFFRKEPDTNTRCLAARTYSVIPLSEDSGIIEWVPNLLTLRDVIKGQYAKANTKVPDPKEMVTYFNRWKVTTDKISFFHEIKARFPPCLGDWYLEHFLSSQCYFRARQNYVRSVAIMSIIGYIIGLGDRHLENILVDLHSGEIVHVDFNCMFNKGEDLTFPETVPFRLTHSMIQAMGPLGIEGPFRKCCEVILSLIEKQKNTLMSYLQPFISDPMIVKSTVKKDPAEVKTMQNLLNVKNRLKGIVKSYKGTSGIPLSSAGQFKCIVEEATSDKNLSLMYFHWSPYI